jgi:hypothetical protein
MMYCSTSCCIRVQLTQLHLRGHSFHASLHAVVHLRCTEVAVHVPYTHPLPQTRGEYTLTARVVHTPQTPPCHAEWPQAQDTAHTWDRLLEGDTCVSRSCIHCSSMPHHNCTNACLGEARFSRLARSPSQPPPHTPLDPPTRSGRRPQVCRGQRLPEDRATRGGCRPEVRMEVTELPCA